MSLNTFVMTNAVVWIKPPGGSVQDLLGHTTSVEIDPPELIKEEFPGMGLFGTPEHIMGCEPMEATIEWSSVNRVIAGSVYNWRDTTQLQIRANLDRFAQPGKSEERPYVVTLDGVWTSFPVGNFNPREFAEFTSVFTIHRAKIEVEGITVFEFDVYSNSWQTQNDGDLLQLFRSNLGV
jgi:P2 family phage contractile tail tube protein